VTSSSQAKLSLRHQIIKTNQFIKSCHKLQISFYVFQVCFNILCNVFFSHNFITQLDSGLTTIKYHFMHFRYVLIFCVTFVLSHNFITQFDSELG